MTSAHDNPVRTRLKWFNNPKGFGFVYPEDEEELDAFLHITTLQKAGVSALGDGACLMCIIERGPKGAQVREVTAVIDHGAVNTAAPSAPPPRPAPVRNSAPAGEILKMGGAVKWYKPDKGFGFIVPDDGQKDIFIHKSCLERHGIDSLAEGRRVTVTVRSVSKGREVIDFSLDE